MLVKLPDREARRGLGRNALTWLCAALLAACATEPTPPLSSNEAGDGPPPSDAPDPDDARADGVRAADAAAQRGDTGAQRELDAAIARPREDASAMANGATEGGPGAARECGGANHEAKAKALEILVLFDNSGSMVFPAVSWDCLTLGEGCADTTTGFVPTLWEVAVSELLTFVNDPRSNGVSLGLKYFATDCAPEAYETPDVALEPLPGQAFAIAESLAVTPLSVGTPTRPALQGALTFMQKRTVAPGYNARSVILIVTDGVPDQTTCDDNTTESVSRIAAQGLAGEPAIPTYVFVTAPDLALDEIAEAGGTSQAVRADLSQEGALSSAMISVRDQEIAALPCEYELPPEYFSDVADPMLVNLRRNGEPVGMVSGAADCAEAGGWYYDDPNQPMRILTCASTCSELKTGGTVDILLDCPTQIMLL